MEYQGIFMLQRTDPIEVLAALVSPSEYKNPEVHEAMKKELMKCKELEEYEEIEDFCKWEELLS